VISWDIKSLSTARTNDTDELNANLDSNNAYNNAYNTYNSTHNQTCCNSGTAVTYLGCITFISSLINTLLWVSAFGEVLWAIQPAIYYVCTRVHSCALVYYTHKSTIPI
jgi:hypothetical protein